MKYGIVSIILALAGISFVIWFNIEISELFKAHFLEQIGQNKMDLNPAVYTTGKGFKIIAFVIATIGIILGIKALREIKWIGIIGIILSAFLSFLAFYPMWKYFVQDLAIDVNFAS
ncbi:hypothetical protein BTO06_11755 [Tenacibaculum sp. SZ-18]|uniref:hypothetical protein n=1 Tax=Tenacibaculum sp. SZ-18 TaxID=754423 RepID=UPI000C2D34AA|nr:hypothetical protein [Tenacibaculum sp. SZ-18]AUC15782.1 hypothetical protein BTO06_11755 [Tenacibaculum sp. SZ-18]